MGFESFRSGFFQQRKTCQGFLQKASRDPPGSVGELIDDYFRELFPPKKSFPKKFLQGYIGELFPPMLLELVFGANFSSDILGSNFIFKYFFVLVDFFGKLFHQIFFLGVSFENCFVTISPQRVCGRNGSSNTFLVEVSAGIYLA